VLALSNHLTDILSQVAGVERTHGDLFEKDEVAFATN
jgi:hypothetical protein